MRRAQGAAREAWKWDQCLSRKAKRVAIRVITISQLLKATVVNRRWDLPISSIPVHTTDNDNHVHIYLSYHRYDMTDSYLSKRHIIMSHRSISVNPTNNGVTQSHTCQYNREWCHADPHLSIQQKMMSHRHTKQKQTTNNTQTRLITRSPFPTKTTNKQKTKYQKTKITTANE